MFDLIIVHNRCGCEQSMTTYIDTIEARWVAWIICETVQSSDV